MSASLHEIARSKGVKMKMHCRKARKNISLAMDDRLAPPARQALDGHLQACPACRAWQQEQSRFADLLRAAPGSLPPPGFMPPCASGWIRTPARRPSSRHFRAFPSGRRWLRAAMVLLLAFSAALGFLLSGRLDAPAAKSDAAAFSQAMNLDVFADLPADSFGAVYDRLLQGNVQ